MHPLRKTLKEVLTEKPPEQERVILHVDLDAFFAKVEEQVNPALRGKPVFVVGHSMTRGIILTANYEARKYGVKTGMSLLEAKRLCPWACLVPCDAAKYTDTSERLFQYLPRFTPLVEIFSIDEAFLDLTGTWHFFSSPEEVARSIKRFLKQEIGEWITCSIGIAPNKLIAKLASDHNKPDGLLCISAGEVPALLEELPVEELCGIGSRLKERLRVLGIHTAGQLGRFPGEILVEQFGILGTVLKRMGQGIDHSPVLPVDRAEEAKSIGHSYTLTEAVRDRCIIQKYLLWLCEKAARRLRRGGYQGRTVYLGIGYGKPKPGDSHPIRGQAMVGAGFIPPEYTVSGTVSKSARFMNLHEPGTFGNGTTRDKGTGCYSSLSPFLGRQKTLPYFLDDGRMLCEEAWRIFTEIDSPHEPVRFLAVSLSGLRRGQRQRWLLEEFECRDLINAVLDRINDRWGEFTVKPAALDFREDAKIFHPVMRLFGRGKE